MLSRPSKLPLANFERKVIDGFGVKCKFCGKGYAKFATLSDHMLRAHHKEIGVELEEIVSEFSEQDAEDTEDDNQCSKCKRSFDNSANRDSHMNVCSGVANYSK